MIYTGFKRETDRASARTGDRNRSIPASMCSRICRYPASIATERKASSVFTNKQLKALIFPLVIEQFLGILVGTMDVIMVSQVGEFATSGARTIRFISTRSCITASTGP